MLRTYSRGVRNCKNSRHEGTKLLRKVSKNKYIGTFFRIVKLFDICEYTAESSAEKDTCGQEHLIHSRMSAPVPELGTWMLMGAGLARDTRLWVETEQANSEFHYSSTGKRQQQRCHVFCPSRSSWLVLRWSPACVGLATCRPLLRPIT